MWVVELLHRSVEQHFVEIVLLLFLIQPTPRRSQSTWDLHVSSYIISGFCETKITLPWNISNKEYYALIVNLVFFLCTKVSHFIYKQYSCVVKKEKKWTNSARCIKKVINELFLILDDSSIRTTMYSIYDQILVLFWGFSYSMSHLCCMKFLSFFIRIWQKCTFNSVLNFISVSSWTCKLACPPVVRDCYISFKDEVKKTCTHDEPHSKNVTSPFVLVGCPNKNHALVSLLKTKWCSN